MHSSYPVYLLLIAVVAAVSSQALQYSPPPTGQPPTPIKLKAGAIVSSSDDSQVDVKAAIWGNPQSESFSSFVRVDRPEASGNSSISRALVAAAYHLRQQGYNAVYLPFAFSDLKDISSTSSSSQGSKLCKQLTLAGLSKKPGSAGSGSSSSSHTATWQSRLSQQSTNAGDVTAKGSQQCMTLLPNTTTLDRHLWSVQWFLANGLYVIFSSVSPGDSSSDAVCAAASSSSGSSVGCTQDAGASADAWVQLWKAVVALPAFEGSMKGRVMLQLAQDPPSSGQVWESTTSSSGQKQPGLQELYLATMDAVDRVSPGSALFILQGPQQQTSPGAGQQKWGNGFSADPALISQGLSDPTPLFKALLKKPYRNQIILSPRVLGLQPSNSTSAQGSTGSSSSKGSTASPAPAAATAELTDGPAPKGPSSVKVLDNAFHQLSQVGFCVSEGNCHKFPVAVTQQQSGGPTHDRQYSGKDSTADPDLELFASFVLSKQGDKDVSPEDVATGNWLQWDLMASTGETEQPAQDANSQGAGAAEHLAPDDSSKASSPTDVTGGQGILAFVYTADDGGKSGTVFDIQQETAETQL